MKNLFFLPLIIVFLLSNLSCGVILDNAKMQGEWNLNKTIYYRYNEEFSSYFKLESLPEDTTSDTEKPTYTQFFGVNASSLKMFIESNSTFNVQDESNNVICKGTWEIDTYNNTFSITTDESTDNKVWGKKGIKITNSWVMSTNNKWQLYIKASDFKKPYFEFTVQEELVPQKIDVARYLTTYSSLSNDGKQLFDVCYKLNPEETYYILQNNISPEDKNFIYQYLAQQNFVYQNTTVKFYAMEAYFLRNGYTE